ncbi:MAG: hypothetical protein KGQ46_13985 [Hyphomicrobiales bacterium]|nr:hypothetical protein [Hyphomicrobiales bacterium]MDE2115815.1 hypothetical protein [Hyphomicrobiales bacterium]
MARHIFSKQTVRRLSAVACLIAAGILPAWGQAASSVASTNAPVVINPQHFTYNPQTTIMAPKRAPVFQWKPMDYYDLTLPGTDAMPYAEIWADKLIENNRAYRKAGDRRFSLANAPATEADWGVYSSSDEVVVTILNTFTCKVINIDPAGHATLKLCPMRLVEFVSGQRRMFNAPDGCFLEFTKQPPGIAFDATRDATYATYDASDHSIRLGTVINHNPVKGCSFHMPIPHFAPDPPMMSRGLVKLPQPVPAKLGASK